MNCSLISNYQVDYSLEFPQANCSGGNESLGSRPPPLTLVIPCGSSVQRVMEIAVDADPSYRFTVTYTGSTVGYTIDTINGTENNDPCFWFFYYQIPGQDPILNESITNFIVPSNRTQVIMRYQTTPVPSPSPSPLPSPSPSPAVTDSPDEGVSSLKQVNVYLLLLMCIGVFLQ